MKLSDEQSKIVEKASGHFLVRACPGSGKTYTIAAKAVEDMESWGRFREGIGLLSFTNTAHGELSEEIKRISGSGVVYPHYVGTIDSFINKYIFFPYISELGFDSSKIQMIGEPHTRYYGWSRAQKCALNLNYELNGDLFYQASAKEIYDEATIENARSIKFATINKSYKFTQADANYYSLKILKSKSYIRETVGARFPYLYVDEAQDTTPVHWEILKLLSCSDGNERFGVIGDPDQSIYGWNGARPELFTQYQHELEPKKQAYYLNDCRRSCQIICNFYFKFSTLPTAPRASDSAIANMGEKPEVVFFAKPDEIIARIDEFKNQVDIRETFVVISRSASTIGNANRYNSGNPLAIDKNPFKNENLEALDVLHAKSDYDQGNYRASIYRAENVYLNMHKIYNREDHLLKQGISKREWLTIVEEDLSLLPPTDLLVGDWCYRTTQYISKSVLFQKIDFIPKKKGKINYEKTKGSDFFVPYQAEDAKKEVETVHSVKGKTTDHVFLVMNNEQTERMLKVLSGQKVSDSEEKRIFYVAISRARKSLTFCVPKRYEPDIKKLKEFLRAK